MGIIQRIRAVFGAEDEPLELVEIVPAGESEIDAPDGVKVDFYKDEQRYRVMFPRGNGRYRAVLVSANSKAEAINRAASQLS